MSDKASASNRASSSPTQSNAVRSTSARSIAISSSSAGADAVSADAATQTPTKKKRDYTGGLSCSARLKKLFTKEDPMHLHKTLGLLALCHFFYRYFIVYPTTGSLGLVDGSVADWAAIALHCALSTSSLIFTVIRTRLLEKPTIIWEEYRLHAIVFSVRGASVYVYAQLWPAVETAPGLYGTDAQIAGLWAFIMLHHVLVDKITDWYGSAETGTTVRGDGKRAGPKFKRLMRLYSLYQFLALGAHLTVHQLGPDIGWNPVIAVQSSAFCMTLYRKRLINGATHATIYTVCLVISAFHIVRMLDGYQNFLLKIGLIYLMRVKLGAFGNKYFLWAAYCSSLTPTVQGLVEQYGRDYAPAAYALAFGGLPEAADGSVFFDNATVVVLWDSSAGFLAYDSVPCRCLTLSLYLYAIFNLRKDERNYPKDDGELKRIDEERKQARVDARKVSWLFTISFSPAFVTFSATLSLFRVTFRAHFWMTLNISGG